MAQLVIDVPSPDKAPPSMDPSTGLTPSFGAVAVHADADALPDFDLGEAAASRPGGASQGSMAAPPPRKSPRPEPDMANSKAVPPQKKPRLSFDSNEDVSGDNGEQAAAAAAAAGAAAEPTVPYRDAPEDSDEDKDASSDSDGDSMLMLLPAHRRKAPSPKKKKKNKAAMSPVNGEAELSTDSPKAPATPTIDPQAAADGWALPKSSSSKKQPGQRGVGKFKRQVSDTPADDDYEDEGDWHEFYEGTKASRGKGAQQGGGGKHTKTGASAVKREYAIAKRNAQRASQQAS